MSCLSPGVSTVHLSTDGSPAGRWPDWAWCAGGCMRLPPKTNLADHSLPGRTGHSVSLDRGKLASGAPAHSRSALLLTNRQSQPVVQSCDGPGRLTACPPRCRQPRCPATLTAGATAPVVSAPPSVPPLAPGNHTALRVDRRCAPRSSGPRQAGTTTPAGPSVAVRETADGAHRPSRQPHAVRNVSVDSAAPRSAVRQGDTRRDREKRPAQPGIPS
jgi:hypothetical protein